MSLVNISLLGTQLLLSSAAAAATAATATATDTNKLVSLSHLFRQQHLPPHRPTFHRHKEIRNDEKPDVAKMKLVNHHSNTTHLLPPVADDYHGNSEHTCSSTDSELLPDEKQLTEDDRQFMNEIRRAPWQPQKLSLTERPVNGGNNRTESVLYEYHLSQPTKVSVDNTTLPVVHRTTINRKKAINTRMMVQQQYKFPSTSTTTPTLYDHHHQNILTTKQLFSKTAGATPASAAATTVTSSIAQHKDRIAQAVELAATSSGRTTSSDDPASSKVAEIRLVFDNSPPPSQQQQQQHVMGMPAVGAYKGDQWSRPVIAASAGNRPHTTDCGITGRPLLVRKPATRAGGMRPIPEYAGKSSTCYYIISHCVCVCVCECVRVHGIPGVFVCIIVCILCGSKN